MYLTVQGLAFPDSGSFLVAQVKTSGTLRLEPLVYPQGKSEAEDSDGLCLGYAGTRGGSLSLPLPAYERLVTMFAF